MLNISIEELNYQTNENGKPYFRNQEIQFNISHSSDIIAITFAKNKEIGIDFELVDPKLIIDNELIDILPETQKKLFSDKSLSDKRLLFYKLWTANESFLKLSGIGLRGAFVGYDLKLKNSEIVLNNFDNELSSLIQISLLDDKYMLSICANSKVINSKIMSVDLDDLI